MQQSQLSSRGQLVVNPSKYAAVDVDELHHVAIRIVYKQCAQAILHGIVDVSHKVRLHTLQAQAQQAITVRDAAGAYMHYSCCMPFKEQLLAAPARSVFDERNTCKDS